jgi:neutral ceramidase
MAQAGWASGDITPPLGLPMGGRGPRFAGGDKVLDRLEAQVTVLQDNKGRRLVWVSLDLIGMGYAQSAELRNELAGLLGAEPAGVILNFSHIHSGPMANFDKYAAEMERPAALTAYLDMVGRKVKALGIEAMAKIRPVQATWHQGTSRIGINRRGRDGEGQIAMRPDPQGSYNEDLWVLRLEQAGAQALLYACGCHPVIVYGFDWTAVSADYVGASRRLLAAATGADHCQFFQGLAGNIRPRLLADGDHFRKGRPSDPEAVGAELAADVQTALAQEGEILSFELAATSGRFLARRDPELIPDVSYWRARLDDEQELQRNLAAYWCARLEAGVPPFTAVPWDIGLMGLDPTHRIAWLAGEPVAEWLPLLRQWLGAPELAVWGYCQDIPCYLPTDALLPEGGYEVLPSNTYGTNGPGPFALGLDQAVRDSFEDLFSRLYRSEL